MKNEKPKLLNKQLTDILENYQKPHVVSDIEKSLEESKKNLVSIDLIDDYPLLKDVEIDANVILNIKSTLEKSGLSFPLVVRENNNRYQLILSRDIFLSIKENKLFDKVPIYVIKANDEETLLLLLINKYKNKNNNIIEIALLLKELNTKYNYSQQTLSKIVKQSRAQITNILRLLKLPKKVQKLIAMNKLNYGTARAILSLDSEQLNDFLTNVNNKQLSVRKVENLVRKIKNKSASLTLNIVDEENKIIIEFKDEKQKQNFLKKISNLT